MSDTEWASMREELDRKTVETIAGYIDLYESGQMTSKALGFAARVITDVTQGLVSREVGDMVYRFRTEARRMDTR